MKTYMFLVSAGGEVSDPYLDKIVYFSKFYTRTAPLSCYFILYPWIPFTDALLYTVFVAGGAEASINYLQVLNFFLCITFYKVTTCAVCCMLNLIFKYLVYVRE